MSSHSIATIGGIGLAATGVAHFVAPQLFHGITAPAFPDDVDTAIKVNGTLETVIGAAIAVPKTRTIGLAGLGLYGAYLAANMVKAQRG